MNKKTSFSLAAVAALALGACGGDESVAVDQPWARATVEAQPHGAVYFDLTLDQDDVLVGVAIEPSIANHAEIHEVVAAEVPMDESMDEGSDGMDMGDADADHGGMAPGMVMQELDSGLVLSADQTVSLEPGGYHVMLLDLAEPLVAGEEFDLTLEFETHDDVTITVPVEETAP